MVTIFSYLLNINLNILIPALYLPDTYYSWFHITELHLWMLMTKCTVLEDNGRHMRNAMIKTFWDDGLTRMKKLQVMQSLKPLVVQKNKNDQYFSHLVQMPSSKT